MENSDLQGKELFLTTGLSLTFDKTEFSTTNCMTTLQN